MSELLGTKVLLATDGPEEAVLTTRAAVEVTEGTCSEEPCRHPRSAERGP